MKVESLELENRQVRLTVEVPPERIEAAMRAAARRLSKNTRIPGFRPGKAPYDVLYTRFGQEAIFEEALDSLGQEAYRQALETQDLEPFAPGSLDEVVSKEPLVLRYTVPLTPTVDLGSYRDLRLDHRPPEVQETALEQFLEELRQSQALIEPAERPAEAGDVVILDIAGSLVADEGGEPEPLLQHQGVSLLVAEDNDWPVPGLAIQLVGIAAGEARPIEHTFDETYPAEDLRGRRATFHLTCHEVKSRRVPDWSDELARDLGDYADLADLRKQALTALENQSARRYEEQYAEEALQAVLAGSTIDFPPQLLEEETGDILRDMDTRLKSQGMNLAEWLKAEGKTEEEIRRELEPRARRQVERSLVLYEIVETESLEVQEAEVDQMVETMVAGAEPGTGEGLRKALQQPGMRRRLAYNLLTEKAMARVALIAQGKEIPPPTEPIDAAAQAPTAEPAPDEVKTE